jgi:hypothetical protein
MTYPEWKAWMAGLPWLLRWFPILLLLRPVIDNLYFLKEVSPLLSPPYLVGVLTPVLCIAAMVRYRRRLPGALDGDFGAWSALLLLACVLLLLMDPTSLVTIEFVLKLSMPVYLYYFLRLLVRDLRDLHALLLTTLYSAIAVAAILLYEVVVSPVRLEESRGLLRIQGSFGDVVSYSMYSIFSVLIVNYFYFSRQHLFHMRKRLALLLPVAALAVLALLNIHHTASYGIFLTLGGLFLAFNLRTRNRAVVVGMIGVGAVVLSVWGSTVIDEKISPLLETDFAVAAGEKESDQLFHGRVGRWRKMLDFFTRESVVAQAIGMPVSFRPVFPFIGVGAHNDFFRLLFATGGVGLFLYMRLLWKWYARAKHMGTAQRYLLYSTLATLLLYSISVTPTFYPPFLYFLIAVMVYAGLPAHERTTWNGLPY